MSIQINNTDIRIRPSSVDTFYQCPYQWAKVFLGGETSIPSNRAAIGTGVHKGAEVLWTDAIKTGKKDLHVDTLVDAAVAEYKEEIAKGVQFDDSESLDAGISEVMEGTKAFVDDIAAYTPIPKAVETFVMVPISGHPLVAEVGGTIDYLGKDSISDLKTSKRKATTSNYTVQQSIYKYLAEANGHKVDYNTIQNVVMKARPEGQVLPIETNVEQAKMLTNTMLDTLRVAASGDVPLEVLFRGNPKYYLCSPKYCSQYNTCPYVKGRDPVKTQVQVAL